MNHELQVVTPLRGRALLADPGLNKGTAFSDDERAAFGVIAAGDHADVNPTSKIEATPADVLSWTNGAALVATGSPFDDVELDGVTHQISQANNVYVFPGLGLGAIAVGARKISAAMLMTAAKAVFAAEEGGVSDGILPPLEVVPQMSRRIAVAVGRCARDEGLTNSLTDAQIDELVDRKIWRPQHRPLVPAEQ